jgi:hypothetical protein
VITALELEIQRKITVAFINADAETILLARTTKVNDGAGGFTMVSGNVTNQVFRLIPQADKTPIGMSNDGDQEQVKFMVMGLYDADIQKDDWFSFNGEEYRIRAVQRRTHHYDMKAEAVLRG